MKVTDLMIKITADAATFRAATQSATRASQQMAERISKNMRKVGAAMSAAVTLPLTMLAKSSLQAADIQAKAEAKVQQALVQTGNAAGFTLEQLKKLAAETQKKTLFGDEQILSDVTGKLLTFTNITGQNFQRLQGLVLDFSTQMKVDAASAAVTLGKALNNPIKATTQLTRVGITFTKEEEKQIKAMAEAGKVAQAQTIILDKLNAAYGGQAEAAARTGAGAIKQMQMAWGDLKETIGTVLMPYISALANRLKGLFERFQNLSPATKKLIVVIAALAAGIGPLLLALGSMNLVLPAIRTGITAITSVLPALKTAIMALTGPLGIILGLIVGIGVAYANMRKQKNQWKENFSQELTGMTDEEIQKEKASLTKLIQSYENEPAMQRKSRWNKIAAFGADMAINGPFKYNEGIKESLSVESATGRTYTQNDIDRMYEKRAKLEEEEKRRADEKLQQEKESAAVTAQINGIIEDITNATKEQTKETEKMGGVLGDLKNQVAELEKKKLLPGTTIEDVAKINTQIKELQKRIEVLGNLSESDLKSFSNRIEKVSTGFTRVAAAAQHAGTAIDTTLRNGKDSTRNQWALDMFSAEGIDFSSALARVDRLIKAYKKGFKDNLENLRKAITEEVENFNNTLRSGIQNAVVGVFQSIGQAIVEGKLFDNLIYTVASQLGQLMMSLGALLIEAGMMMAEFRAAIISLLENPYAAIAVGAAMVAAGAAITAYAQKQAKKKTSQIALANGGLAYGPTLALVGDNMNASSDPEVIAPLSKLKDYTGGGVQQIDLRVTGEFKTKGRDLVATIGKENYRYRTMGID